MIFLGLVTLGAAYFLDRALRKRILTVLILLAGVGAIGVGLFPETTGTPHLVFALLAFVFGGLAAIVAFRIEPWPVNLISVILGAMGLAALVLYSIGADLGLGTGGMERMIVYPALIWELLFGGVLMGTPEGKIAAAPD